MTLLIVQMPSGQIHHFVLKLIFKKYAGVSKVIIYFYLPIIFGQLAIISQPVGTDNLDQFVFQITQALNSLKMFTLGPEWRRKQILKENISLYTSPGQYPVMLVSFFIISFTLSVVEASSSHTLPFHTNLVFAK